VLKRAVTARGLEAVHPLEPGEEIGQPVEAGTDGRLPEPITDSVIKEALAWLDRNLGPVGTTASRVTACYFANISRNARTNGERSGSASSRRESQRRPSLFASSTSVTWRSGALR
jgi:hypothetical protein